jgi:hypothetical protein
MNDSDDISKDIFPKRLEKTDEEQEILTKYFSNGNEEFDDDTDDDHPVVGRIIDDVITPTKSLSIRIIMATIIMTVIFVLLKQYASFLFPFEPLWTTAASTGSFAFVCLIVMIIGFYLK